jgi:hypothetical protein
VDRNNVVIPPLERNSIHTIYVTLRLAPSCAAINFHPPEAMLFLLAYLSVGAFCTDVAVVVREKRGAAGVVNMKRQMNGFDFGGAGMAASLLPGGSAGFIDLSLLLNVSQRSLFSGLTPERTAVRKNGKQDIMKGKQCI